MPAAFDPSVYLVVDPEHCAGRSAYEVTRMAVSGGATAVQLRHPAASTRELVEAARDLVALLRPLAIPLIVNDRADVALAAGADGVHVGQDDLPAGVARALMGPNRIVGLSIRDEHDLARSADALDDVDYLGVGPVHPTGSKADAAPDLGLAGLGRIRGLTGLAIVAIGGIDAARAGAAVAAGADGVAVLSAICSAADPERAAREIAAQVEGGRATSAA